MGHGAGQQGRIGQGRQFNPGHAIRVVGLNAVCGCQRECGLAHAASTEHSDQPVLLQQPIQSGEIVLAPDHADGRRWKCAGYRHGWRRQGQGRCRQRPWRQRRRVTTWHIARRIDQVQREPIASPWKGGNGLVAQQFAQGSDLGLEVAVIDLHALPHLL